MSKNRVLTLYYHRVNSLKNDYNLLCVSPIKFRQQMMYLKSNYQIVRFEEDWKSLDCNAVSITFDDGYLDNLQYALPVLEELEIPATIFISTGTINQDKELWWDELERLMLVGNDIPSFFRLVDDEFGCEWNTSTWEYRENCYRSLHYLMRNFINPEKRENWIVQMWDWRQLRRNCRTDNLTLSPDDIKRVGKSKMVSVGAHTVSHPSLANLNKKMQECEIKQSIDKLSGIVENRITLFSYPFGNAEIDFNDETIEICRQSGILKAASTESALWNSKINPYRIPRKVVRDWNIDEFDTKITSYWEE